MITHSYEIEIKRWSEKIFPIHDFQMKKIVVVVAVIVGILSLSWW